MAHPNQKRFGRGVAWPPKKVARLQELRAMGYGPARIAALMGLTKCSVIGKLDRIRIGEGPGSQARKAKRPELSIGERDEARRARALSGRLNGKAKNAKRKAKNNNPTGITAAKVRARAAQALTTGGPLPPSLASVPRISIDDIGHRQCRYIGERPAILMPDTPLYCGLATDGGPWCPQHRARVFQLVRAAAR